MAQCGHVQLPVGHAAHDVRIQPAQEVDVEVHVRSGRHEREPLREAVQEFEDRVDDGLPVDLPRIRIQQCGQESRIAVHREAHGREIVQGEALRLHQAGERAVRFGGVHARAAHPDLQQFVQVAVHSSGLHVDPQERLRLPIPVFVLFPHDSSFQSLCHSMISICVSRCAVPSSNSHHQSPFQSRIGALSGSRQLGMM